MNRSRSSSYEQQEEVQYESGRNDNEMENIEVDEPVAVQRHAYQVGRRIKNEAVDTDPLYVTSDYVVATPTRKSLTKRQSLAQSNGKFFCLSFSIEFRLNFWYL